MYRVSNALLFAIIERRWNIMRKKTLGIALIMAMGAALYGCGTTESTEAEGPAVVADESDSDNPANDVELQAESIPDNKDEVKKDESVSASSTDTSKDDSLGDGTSAGPSGDGSLEPNESNMPTMEEGSEGMSGDNADAKRQIELIVENSDKWISTSGEEYYYTVTDLDHDGKLELIAATNQGTGLYTYLNMFEVNDTNDGLTELTCGDTSQEGGSLDLPDIIINGNFVTYNKGSEYIYIASDFIRGTGTESYEALEAFKLDGANLKVETIARKSMNGDDVEYKDSADQTITEDEFLNSADTKFGADYTKYETTFQWDLLEGDDMSNKLLNCYKAFAGN